MKKTKEEIGITLIALVVTIIVLLILVGITILMITESRLFERAADAKKQHVQAQEEEHEILLEYKKTIDNNIGKDERGISIPEILYVEKGKTLEVLAKLTGELTGTANWKIDDTNIATINSEVGNKITLTALGESGTTTTLEASIVHEEKTYSKKCTINIVAGLNIGDYVEYGVTYTDVNTDNPFSETTGWRVLDSGTLNNQSGLYEGTKLVSTGIPVKLNWSVVTENGEWFGTSEMVDKLFPKEDTKVSELGYIAPYSAAGLRENFGKIQFLSKDTSENNKGFYVKVNDKTGVDNDGNPILLSENEFIVSGKTKKVYCLTLEELNKARNKENLLSRDDLNANDGAKGLFYLSALEEFGYPASKGIFYYLATPTPNSYSGLSYVNGTRVASLGNGISAGLRPVIELSSGIYKDQNIWKIK